MGGAPVIRRVELRLIVRDRVSGVIGDPGPELGSEELGAHVADHLPRPQSWPEEVREVGRGMGSCEQLSGSPQPWL